MADTSASIRLRAIDQGLIGTVDKATNTFTGLTVGALAAEKAFQGIGLASRTAVGQMVLGTQNADKLAGAMGNLASKSSLALNVFGKLSDIGFATSQALNFAKGVQEAAIAYSRIPATLDLMNRSGVQTQSIQDFEQLREAIKGNEASLEQFAVSAVANLGKFEQAAARAGTILRSSTRFDATGQAQRATAGEQMQNALQVQKLVNGEINNTVSSTEALLGQYQVLSANFTKTADSQKVLASGLKLVGIGRAGGVAADPVATLDLLSKTLNAYELSADDAAKTGAILNGVIERGLTTVPELSLNFADTAKTAKTAGISLVDLGSGVATLTAQGVGTAQALTGIERLANTVINKTPESSAALAKLSAEAGKPIRFDVAEVQAKGFTQALIDLNVAAKGNVQVLSEIFPEAIAFQTVIKLLAQDGKKLADNTASLGTVTAGSLDEVFKLATGDRLSRLEQVANRFQELLIEIAQNLAPVFEPGINALEGISSFFSNLPDPVKQAIGQFIVFQIQSKAVTSSVGILFKTLLSLASAYLQVRAFSLLLSGQLGKEVAVIRDLITQRKGLLAVGLQMFGIDQRSRLAIENTTAALEKQNVVTKLLSGTREKLSGVGTANLAGFRQQAAENASVVARGVEEGIAKSPSLVSRVGGAIAGSQTYQALKSQGQQIVQNNQFLQGALAQLAGGIASAGQLAGAVRSDVGGAIDAVTGRTAQPKQLELFDTNQYTSTTARLNQFVEQGKDKLEELKGKAGEAFDALSGRDRTVSPGQLDLFDTGAYQSTSGRVREEVQGAAASGYDALAGKATEVREAIIGSTQALDLEAQKLTLTGELVERDATVRAKSAASVKARNELLIAQQSLQAKAIALENAGLAVAEQELITNAARNEAIRSYSDASLTQEERTRIYNAALEDENKLTQLNTNLQSAQIEKLAAQDQVRVARLEAERATVSTLDARLHAEERLAPVAALTVDAEVARTAAIEAETAATIALAEAEALERVAQGSPEAIAARTKATQLQTDATRLRAIATQQTTAAEVTYEATARASQLAEQGLAEARIFGSRVQFATTGPMGAINKLLTTEITLKKASAAASTTWVGAGNVFKGSLEVMKVALGGTVTGLSALGKAAGGAVSGGLNAIVGFLGSATPLFIAAGAAALIFKDQIWGIGAASRELSKSFDEAIKKNEELQRQFGTDRRLLAFKEQVGAVGDTAATEDLNPVRQQLLRLRESGDLTTGQFNQLAKSLDAVGSSGTVNADKLKEFKSQLDAVRQGAAGEVEEGVFAPVGKGLKGLWDATINAPKNIAATVGGVLTLPVDLAFGNATLEDAMPENWGQRLLKAQDANALIKPLSQLGKAQGQVGNALIDTSRSIGTYNKGLGLTDEGNQKLRAGIALTTADLEREQQTFEQQRKTNDQLISGYEKTLEETVKTAEKVKDPELKAELLGQTDVLRSQIDALKQRNEQLKAGYDNLVKYQQVLKDLKAALTDTTDPARALAAAQDDFNQKFVVDAKGKITPFIKDINTLRTEAGRYAESITSATQYATTGPALTTTQRAALQANNPFAVIEKQGVSYQDAAQRLREVRDDMLTLPSGEKGYRLALDQRRELTKTIVEMDQSAARERITADEIAVERQRLLQGQRKQSAETTEKEITRLTISQTKQQLIIKEAQIKELRGMGLKTTAEDAEASKLRIKIAQTEAEQIERNRQREIALRQGQFDVERERIRTRRARRGISADSEQEQIAQVEIKAARDRLKTLEEEYERSGKTDRELRQKIAIAREQLEQTIAQTEEQARERRFQKRLKQIQNQAQAEILTFQQAVAQSSARSKDLELGQQLFGSRRQLAETLSTAYEQGLQNQSKLTGDAVVRAQLEAKIVDRRLQLLPQTQAAEREQLRIQIQLNQLGLEREAIQARIAGIENQRNIATARLELQRAIRDKQSPEEIKAIQLQIQGLEQQSGIIDTQIAQAEKAKNQNREIAANSEKELAARQKTAQETAKVEAYLARVAVQQALINREIARNNNEATAQTQALQQIVSLSEVRSKNLELDQQLQQSRTSLIEAELAGFEGITQAQLKLIGDGEKRSQLEREIVERRLTTLPLTQAAERESLQVQIQLNQLGLEREATQARIAKIENDRNLKQARLELRRAQLENKAPEEIEAIQLQIQGYEQQGELLGEREGQTTRAIAQSKELNANQLKELDIRQRTATVNAQVELTLARAAEKQAAIAKQVQIIELLTQARELDLQGETKQLEAQNQTLDQRKQLLEAQQNIIKGQIESQTSQLSIASEATKSELKRRELAQAIAAIRLRSVLQQIEYERQVLDLNQQQQKMALEREKVANRIAQATNLADIAKAQAEIAKVQASPTATPLEMAAAQMQLRARLEEGAGLRFSGALLDQRGQVEERLRQYERQGQEQRYAAQYNQARLDFAQTLPEGRQREAMRQLYNDALTTVVGNTGNVRGITDLAQAQFFGANRAAFMYGGSGYAQPQVPNIQAPDYERYRRDALAQFQEFAVKPPDLSAQIRDLTVRSPQVKVPALEQALQQQQQQPTKQGDTNFNIEINLPVGATPKEIPQQLDTGEVVKVFSDIWSRVKQMRS